MDFLVLYFVSKRCALRISTSITLLLSFLRVPVPRSKKRKKNVAFYIWQFKKIKFRKPESRGKMRYVINTKAGKKLNCFLLMVAMILFSRIFFSSSKVRAVREKWVSFHIYGGLHVYSIFMMLVLQDIYFIAKGAQVTFDRKQGAVSKF